MNKVSITILFLLASVAMWAQSLEKNFVIGAQLPLFNTQKNKDNSETSINELSGYHFCINTFIQTDFYDPNRYGIRSKFSFRVDYTYLQAPQKEQKGIYNQLQQMSVLYILGGMHKTYGLQFGLGPAFNWGDAKGINARGLIEMYIKYKKIITMAGLNLHFPSADRKEYIGADNYRYGHVSIGLAYNL